MTQDPLKSRLRADAGDLPPFSPELHERVLQRLREGGAAPVMKGHSARRWGSRLGVPLALAAAAAVVAWVVLEPRDTRVAPPPTHPVVEMPGISPSRFIAPLQENVGPTVEAIDRGKYGYLDKDAERLAIFVADQMPSFPAPNASPATSPATGNPVE